MWDNYKKLKIFPLLLILSISCRPVERLPMGDERDILLIYDGAKELVKIIIPELEKVYYTPHEEKLFNVIPLTLEQLTPELIYKNNLIITYPNASNYRLYKRIFGDRTYGIFEAKNAFKEGDYTLGISAGDPVSLERAIKENIDRIKELFLNRVYSLYEKKVYFAGRNKWLKKEIEEKYGLILDTPEGWSIYREESARSAGGDNFVSIAKHYPDRFIFLYKEEAPRTITHAKMEELRDRLTGIYYEGDSILLSSVRAEWVKFKEKRALRLIGSWQNRKRGIGGAFLTIALNYNNRFYLLDCGIFAPDKRDKLEYLLRMELIIKTLQIKD